LQYAEYRADLLALIHGNRTMEGVYITLRMRLRCEIFRRGVPIPGKVFEVLNEIVVDRGASPYLCKIECYERNRLITKVRTRMRRGLLVFSRSFLGVLNWSVQFKAHSREVEKRSPALPHKNWAVGGGHCMLSESLVVGLCVPL
jgi:hypothetical protein